MYIEYYNSLNYIQVLVEMGSFAGHRLIQEAKDYILKVSLQQVSFLDSYNILYL